jgi:hypothetical protein
MTDDAARARARRTDGRALPWDIPLAGAPRANERELTEPPPVPAPDGPDGPTISVIRRRPPRERE